jgi:hypothetical protein
VGNGRFRSKYASFRDASHRQRRRVGRLPDEVGRMSHTSGWMWRRSSRLCGEVGRMWRRSSRLCDEVARMSRRSDRLRHRSGWMHGKSPVFVTESVGCVMKSPGCVTDPVGCVTKTGGSAALPTGNAPHRTGFRSHPAGAGASARGWKADSADSVSETVVGVALSVVSGLDKTVSRTGAVGRGRRVRVSANFTGTARSGAVSPCRPQDVPALHGPAGGGLERDCPGAGQDGARGAGFTC